MLIAAHPTRGVDIGAQAAIWDKLRVARDQGLAVLLIFQAMDAAGKDGAIEHVMSGVNPQRINARLTPGDATPELLGTYMTGGLQEVAS